MTQSHFQSETVPVEVRQLFTTDDKRPSCGEAGSVKKRKYLTLWLSVLSVMG